MSKDYAAIIEKHVRDSMPDRIKNVITLANYDLFNGPPLEGYGAAAEELSFEEPETYEGLNFKKCCREIRDWFDDNTSTLWLDTESECISDTNPEFWDREDEDDPGPDLSDYIEYDRHDIKKAVLGEIASYL